MYEMPYVPAEIKKEENASFKRNEIRQDYKLIECDTEFQKYDLIFPLKRY